jgi:hypothetical protein
MVESRDGIEEQTGTGVARSSDGTVRSPSISGEDVPDLNVNRSGSGGTGGPAADDEDGRTEGSNPESMDELLGG